MFKIRITPAMAEVFAIYVGGSEYLDAAMDAGVTWTSTTLTVPTTREALEATAGFIGLRAEIGADNLAEAKRSPAEWFDAQTLAEYRASVALDKRWRAATGISTAPFQTARDVTAYLAAQTA